MSDVSKTNAVLLEEAKRLIADCSTYNFGLRTADRLAHKVAPQLVAALEAATRVPVQGEPNDDRTPEFEAIEQELFKHQPLLSMQDGSIRGCKCMDRVFVTKTEDWGTHLAEVFEQLSRATAPDAATGEGESRAWAIASHLEVDREAVKAERDSALAAIERVRAIHANAGPSQGYDSRFKGGYGMLDDCCAACGSHGEYGVEWPCPTVAALDGAPEPDGIARAVVEAIGGESRG